MATRLAQLIKKRNGLSCLMPWKVYQKLTALAVAEKRSQIQKWYIIQRHVFSSYSIRKKSIQGKRHAQLGELEKAE